MQRLFFALFPKTLPRARVFGPMDSDFLDNVLAGSKKVWTKSTTPGVAFESELLPYQKKCLNWLIHRETDESTSAWGWTRRQLNDGFTFHTSVFGHISLTPPNTTIRGGLLAQDVGMGKTVEILALVTSNKANGPTLIVLPTTMLSVWQSEAAARTPSVAPRAARRLHGSRW